MLYCLLSKLTKKELPWGTLTGIRPTKIARTMLMEGASDEERMWENVEALLKEAGMNYDDIGQMIVYLRDPGDYQTVERLFNARFPNMPRVTVLAPVCRPGWLIEMECMGTCKWTDKRFRAF